MHSELPDSTADRTLSTANGAANAASSSTTTGTGQSRMAILIDADNAVACLSGPQLTRLCEYLERFGHIQSLRAYGDWERLGKALNVAGRFHINPVHLPTAGKRRKNGVDIAMAVDAIDDLHLAPEIDTFVLVTGDGDLAPVALRLRERGRRVIGLGRKQMTSDFLVRACDKFIYLESLGIGVDQASASSPLATQVYDALRGGNNGSDSANENGSATSNGSSNGARNGHVVESASVYTEVPPDLREAFHRTLEELAAKSDEINAGVLKQNLLLSYSTFREQDFGVKRFSDFLAQFADQIGIDVKTSRGNGLLVSSSGARELHRARAECDNVSPLKVGPVINGFEWVSAETFVCGAVRHTLNVYRSVRIAQLLGTPKSERDPAAEFVLLPGGTHRIGIADGLAVSGTPAGRPQQTVTLAPFLMARTPLTQDVWDRVRAKRKVRRIDDQRYFTRRRGGHKAMPIEGVDRNDATRFLAALKMRLPSEAEWEYACRGGTGNEALYFWGSDEALAHDYAWTKEISEGKLHEVATTRGGANAFGLYDMAGNVWEWCADVWSPSHDGLPSDGTPREFAGDPLSEQPLYVVRGGSFHYPITACRSDFRWRLAPTVRHPTVGFRPVATVKPSALTGQQWPHSQSERGT